jgi:hypothetical protein
MNGSSSTSLQHPDLARLTANLAVIGRRQEANAVPTWAQSVLLLGLSIATVAALIFG